MIPVTIYYNLTAEGNILFTSRCYSLCTLNPQGGCRKGYPSGQLQSEPCRSFLNRTGISGRGGSTMLSVPKQSRCYGWPRATAATFDAEADAIQVMCKITKIIGATFFCLTLSTHIHAGSPESSQDSQRKTPATVPDKDTNQGSQGLEQRMSPEQRERFNRDMETQTGEAYPDHAQIESRRRKMRERMQERLQQADIDHDNSISRAEAEESMPGVARHFDQIDANHDGFITYDEMKTAQEKKHDTADRQVKQEISKKGQPKPKKKRTPKKSHIQKQPELEPLPATESPSDEVQQPL
jgi:Ca2+-binding EF-hand superfamily protein